MLRTPPARMRVQEAVVLPSLWMGSALSNDVKQGWWAWSCELGCKVEFTVHSFSMGFPLSVLVIFSFEFESFVWLLVCFAFFSSRSVVPIISLIKCTKEAMWVKQFEIWQLKKESNFKNFPIASHRLDTIIFFSQQSTLDQRNFILG